MKTRRVSILVLLLLLLLLLLLFGRGACRRAAPPTQPSEPVTEQRAHDSASGESAPSELAPEKLGEATLSAPARVDAGAEVSVEWTGPANAGDFLVLVTVGSPDAATGSYELVGAERSLTLVAPVEPGPCELRYVTARSRTVLARAPIEVVPVVATLDAPSDVVLGSRVSVSWSGPDNPGDYITLVAKDAPDGHFANYTTTDRGSPLEVVAPSVAGEGELRYMTGRGGRVLARRALRILQPDITLDAPEEAVAGATLDFGWTGPNNAGDYITVVAKQVPDGQYGNYVETAKGSPTRLLLPILTGEAELRYMTGQGRNVLARRALLLRAAEITLSPPEQASAGADVSIAWTGPDHRGDYLTIVARDAADGHYGHYSLTSGGSPLVLKAPAATGDAEVRYMSGQGSKVLARASVRIVP